MVLLSPGCTLLYCVFVFQELQETPVSLQDGWMLFLSVISQGILDHALYGSLVYPLLALLIDLPLLVAALEHSLLEVNG